MAWHRLLAHVNPFPKNWESVYICKRSGNRLVNVRFTSALSKATS